MSLSEKKRVHWWINWILWSFLCRSQVAFILLLLTVIPSPWTKLFEGSRHATPLLCPTAPGAGPGPTSAPLDWIWWSGNNRLLWVRLNSFGIETQILGGPNIVLISSLFGAPYTTKVHEGAAEPILTWEQIINSWEKRNISIFLLFIHTSVHWLGLTWEMLASPLVLGTAAVITSLCSTDVCCLLSRYLAMQVFWCVFLAHTQN